MSRAASFAAFVVLAVVLAAAHDLVITRKLTIRGVDGDPACVTIDGQGLGRILTFQGYQPSELVGVTLTGGDAGADGDGGALIASGASGLSIRDCVFEGNAARAGGGVHFASGWAEISNCTFRNNAAVTGSALRTSYCRLEVRDCRFTRNLATDGTVAARGAQPAFTSCEFDSNTAVRGGAAYGERFGHLQFFGCRFLRNHAEEGGAIWTDDQSERALRRPVRASHHGRTGDAVQTRRVVYLGGGP